MIILKGRVSILTADLSGTVKEVTKMFMQELLYFVTTAEHLNFTSAANQLFITQSGLSKSIAKMEAELGFPLFTRGKRALELTPAGKSFLTSANTFLMECNYLKMLASSGNEVKQGGLAVGVSSHYGHYGHQYLNLFLNMFPDMMDTINLDIQCMPLTALGQSLHKGALDFVIATKATVGNDPDFRSMLLLRRKRHIILSERHPLASAAQLQISQLRDEAFTIMNRLVTPHSYDVVITLCNCVGFYPKIVKRADNFDTLYMLIGSGKALTISSVSPDPFTCPDLKAIPIDASELPLETGRNALNGDLYLTWNRNNHNSLIPTILERLEPEVKPQA